MVKEIDIPEDVKDFIKTVENLSTGYKVSIIGGYLRDTQFGLKPKDLDIALVPKDNCVSKSLPTVPKTYVNYNISSIEIPDMEDRGVDRVIGMFVPSLSTEEVQFIVYKEPFTRQSDLARDMDMNINQICWNLSEGIDSTLDYLNGHKYKTIECTHKYDEYRMYKRFKRMSAKFPDYKVISDLDFDYFDIMEKVDKELGTYKVHVGSFVEE